MTQRSALLSCPCPGARALVSLSVLPASLSNSSPMAREKCKAIVLHLPSHCDVCAERYSGEDLLPTLPAPSSLLQKLAACCLFPPAFNLGVGLRGMNPADSRLSAAGQRTTLSWGCGVVGTCLFIK